MDKSDASLQRAGRSRAALDARFPDLGEAFARLGPSASSLTGTVESGDLNIDLGHGLPFYRDGAIAYTDVQIAAWRKSPGRFYMEPPLLRVPPLQLQDHIAGALYQHCRDLPMLSDEEGASGDAGGYMLVYGIGLGLHLPVLFDEAPVRHFILIEEHLEFLRHSLAAVDWARLLDGLEARGQTLNIVMGTDPHVVAARVHWMIRGRGFGLIDGSYLYRHYRSTLLDIAHQDFVKNLPLLPISIGYWEDEMAMIDHCTRNLAEQEFRLLDARPRLEKDVPAFIVGSGPSLDKTIDTVARYADRAVIFSSGTALQPLLNRGIRPDFHCELENGYGSVEHLLLTAEKHSLAGITLLASTTVYPVMPALFCDRVFYFRDSVSSTPLWCPDGLGIFGTAPTCTNLALRAAILMAFREIYLFGIDLGTRVPGVHHTNGSIYDGNAHLQQLHETEPLKIMSIPMPGNFGGRAFTNQILQWARMMMVQSIDVFSQSRIFNCSDGVSIPGALPKLASSIRLSVAPTRRTATLERLRQEMEFRHPGEMVPRERFAAFCEVADAQYSAMLDEIAVARSEGWGFVQFYERMQKFLDRGPCGSLQAVLRALNVGSMMMWFQIGFFFHRRLPEEERPAMMRVFLDTVEERIAVVKRETAGNVAKVFPLWNGV